MSSSSLTLLDFDNSAALLTSECSNTTYIDFYKVPEYNSVNQSNRN